MPNFVFDSSSLSYPKTDLNPVPGGADATKYVAAADWNSLNQAAVDIRAALTGKVTGSITISGSISATATSNFSGNLKVADGYIIQDFSDGGPSGAPEHHWYGQNGKWAVGIDVAQTPSSRDFVSVAQRANYGFVDGVTTGSSNILSSPSYGGFSSDSDMSGTLLSGSGIPAGTRVNHVISTTQLAMTNNATTTATGVRVTVTFDSQAPLGGEPTSDIFYARHRGRLVPTFGLGVTPPDSRYRLQVAASDSENALGGISTRVGPSQTGRAFCVYDSNPIDRVWITSGYFFGGNHPLGGAMYIQDSNRILVLTNNNLSNYFAFDWSGSHAGAQSVTFKNATNALSTWEADAVGNMWAIHNFGVDGILNVVGAVTASNPILMNKSYGQGSGMNDALTVSDTALNQANDGLRFHFSQGNVQNAYNGWIALRNNNSNPSVLDPRWEFAVQQGGTSGITNVTASLIVQNFGIQVTGSILGNGNAVLQGSLTGSGGISILSIAAAQGNFSVAGSGFTTINSNCQVNGQFVNQASAQITGALSLTGTFQHQPSSGKIGFFGTTPVLLQTVTGSRSTNPGVNGAIVGILNALAAYGIIINNTTA